MLSLTNIWARNALEYLQELLGSMFRPNWLYSESRDIVRGSGAHPKIEVIKNSILPLPPIHQNNPHPFKIFKGVRKETLVHRNIPQLIKVLPINSFVSGFQTKRRKFSIRSLQVFFSFKVAILPQNFPQKRLLQKWRNSTGTQRVAQANCFGFYTFPSTEGQGDHCLYQRKPLHWLLARSRCSAL